MLYNNQSTDQELIVGCREGHPGQEGRSGQGCCQGHTGQEGCCGYEDRAGQEGVAGKGPGRRQGLDGQEGSGQEGSGEEGPRQEVGLPPGYQHGMDEGPGSGRGLRQVSAGEGDGEGVVAGQADALAGAQEPEHTALQALRGQEDNRPVVEQCAPACGGVPDLYGR